MLVDTGAGTPLSAPGGPGAPAEERTFFGLPTALRPDGRLSATSLRPIKLELRPLRGPHGSSRCTQVSRTQGAFEQQQQPQHYCSSTIAAAAATSAAAGGFVCAWSAVSFLRD